VPPDLAGEQVDLDVASLPLADVYAIIGPRVARHAVAEHGVIVLATSSHTEIGFYDVGPLVAPRQQEDADSLREQLADMIRSQVGRGSWDDPKMAIRFLGDRMIVRQTPAIHADLRAMLAALERALEPR
jgi:hypothetical protein